MELKLDTINKIVKIEDKVNIGELYDMFAELRLDVDEWTLVPIDSIPEKSIWSSGNNPFLYRGTTDFPLTGQCTTSSQPQDLSTGILTGNTCTNVKGNWSYTK